MARHARSLRLEHDRPLRSPCRNGGPSRATTCATPISRLSRDPERRLALEGTRALGNALAGRPVDALRVAAGIRHAATVSNLVVLRAELALAEAIAHRELGDRSPALTELEEMAAMPAETMLYCRIIAIAGAHRGTHRRRRTRRRSGRLRTSRVADRVRVLRNRLPAVAGQSRNTAGCRGRRHRRRGAVGAADRRSVLGGRQQRPGPPRRRELGGCRLRAGHR